VKEGKKAGRREGRKEGRKEGTYGKGNKERTRKERRSGQT
jgi:hypothetical protein